MTQQLVEELQEQGADMPCANLITLFDQAVNEKRLDAGDVLQDFASLNAAGLDEIFNKFTAKKLQHECDLTTKDTVYPTLDVQIKQSMVKHLNKAYGL